MSKQEFEKRLREIYKTASDFYIAFPDINDFVEHWVKTVTKQSEGKWDYEVASEVFGTIISSR